VSFCAYTVSTHEAYRLSGLERRDARLDARVSADLATCLSEQIEDPRARPDCQHEARAALARVAALARASDGCSRCRSPA
jgi:hypothetical protein